MVEKKLFAALVVISMFLVSACDVYNTLYVKEQETGEALEVPEGNITMEIQSMEEEEEGFTEIPSMEEESAEEISIEIEEEAEEEGEKEISGEATVLIVEETEKVSLVPKAEDPDKDVLSFTFTSPLNSNGEWQTGYGDAGEYTITVTASDGLLTTSREVLIIVNRKEEAPVLNSFSPKDTAVKISETDAVSFNVAASDLNKDNLAYAWKLDGVEIGNKDSIEYKTTYEDSGSHTMKVAVSDSMFTTEKIWSITVNNVNRKPVLEKITDVEAKETDTVVIELEASDPDGDKLTYSIDDKKFVQDGNSFAWETSYDDAGEHSVTVTVSDGTDSTSQEFTVKISNVNRPPVILDIVQKQ
ncbi:hypothetical protein KY347_02060 [Candidatus Woesearchaeota archaeon]|nr:hypothetical protein [Candidatus Woesearchaeota archaeon]